jgi:hypothetical protein
LVQTGFLERELEEGLDSVLGYAREALTETINIGIGETLTRTRKGRLIPNTTPLNPAAINAGLDNGMIPSTFSSEQYQFTLAPYGQSADVNLAQELAAIANLMIAYSRNNGVAAAQTLDRIAQNRLFSAYLGGNTRVRTDLGASSTTTCHVNDIRGFQFVSVNGVLTPISGTYPLTVTEVKVTSSGVSQTLSVTGAAADATNSSSTPGGISGVLTFATATAPVNLDALIAANAPAIFRPNNKPTDQQLTVGDSLTLGLVLDAVAYLRDNGVPPIMDPDGDGASYHCLLDNSTMRQLFADQQFLIAYQSQYQSQEYRRADIVRIFDTTFIPTTEAPVQQVGAGGDPNLAVRVRRPIVIGAEALIRGNFEGLEMWLNDRGFTPIGEVFLVNGVAQIIRPPMDRLQQIVSMTWHWIGDFAVPTDITAGPSIIPTASNSLYKRSAVIEVAG